MKLSDIFGGAPQAQPQQQGAPSPDQVAQLQNQQQMPQPNTTGAPEAFQATPASKPDELKSPLDEFDYLFKLPEKAGDDPEAALKEELFKVDPEKLAAAAGNLDFLAGTNGEDFTKAMAGDTEAFMNVLRAVAQNSFLESTKLNSNLVQQGVDRRIAALDNVLPNRFRQYQVQNQPSEMPALDHQALKPLVNALTQQALAARPEASPEDIQKTVQQYLQTVGSVMNSNSGNQPNNAQQAMAGGTDFSSFFGS